MQFLKKIRRSKTATRITQNVNHRFYSKIKKYHQKKSLIIENKKKVKVKSSMSEVKWDYLKQNTS